MVDSGKTIREVIEHLKNTRHHRDPRRRPLHNSPVRPRLARRIPRGQPWIHQPFECYDALGPAKLIELVEAKEAAKKA
ncbi:MAG: hypothetical protein ACLUHG_00185 [Sutterella wadsworthensis]